MEIHSQAKASIGLDIFNNWRRDIFTPDPIAKPERFVDHGPIF
jgi:hypothetical protein